MKSLLVPLAASLFLCACYSTMLTIGPRVGLDYGEESRAGEVYLRVGKAWRLESIVRVEDKRKGKATPPLQEAP